MRRRFSALVPLIAVLLGLSDPSMADGGFIRRGNVTGANPLFTSLVACYKLDEASGTRADSSGNGYTLTDNNTVTQNTGIIGSAGQFTKANSEYLSKSSVTNLQITGDTTLSGWFYLDSENALDSQVIVAKATSYPTTSDYVLTFQLNVTTRTVLFRIYHSGGNATATYTIGTSAITGAWHYVIARYRASDGKMTIKYDAQTEATSTESSTPMATTGAFEIGAFGAADAFMDGRIDVVKKWTRYLSDAEEVLDFNGGVGVDCPN